jgi:S-adenosylmethionine:tRNA-ribosyltransferase-isomerase (queuine synthetase)
MKLAIQFLQPIMFINEKRKIRNGKNVIVCSRELAPKESKFRCCWTHAILKTNLTDEQADFLQEIVYKSQKMPLNWYIPRKSAHQRNLLSTPPKFKHSLRRTLILPVTPLVDQGP